MKTYCVIFRSGTRENFHWERTQAMPLEQANEVAAEKNRDSCAYVADWKQSLAVGLPETFDLADRTKASHQQKSQSCNENPKQTPQTSMPDISDDLIQADIERPGRLKERILARPQTVFFYPAGLYDWEPLRLFADLCDTFIYCDLAINQEEFPSGLQGLHAIGIGDIPQPEEISVDGGVGGVSLKLGIDDQPWLEKFLTPVYREQYNPAINIIQGCGGPWGRQLRLHFYGREVMVYCFRAEAFRCYTALFTEQNVAPKVVCLKNPLGLRRFLVLDCWSTPLGRAVADSPQPELLITDLPRRPECDWPWKKKWRDYPEWQATAYWRQHPVTYSFLMPNV